MLRNRFILGAHVVALSLAADAPAAVWHLLVPAGKFSGRDGRGPWDAGDAASMQKIVEASLKFAGGTDLVVDYDHQSVFASVPNVGGRAPAAGWIKELQARPDGIYGLIEWTASAAAAIRAGEYRYLSPYFRADKADRVDLVMSAGLTNTPAMDLEAIAARALSDNGAPMDKIAQALGLATDATEAQILAAIGKFSAFRTSLVSAVALSASATDESVVAAVAALRSAAPDPAKFVPADQVVALQSQLASLQATVTGGKAQAAVDKAVAEGKVPPALKEWALSRATADLADFEKYVASAPVVVTPGGKGPPQRVGTVDTLDDGERVVMRALGLTEAQMLASKKSQQEAV